MHLDFARGTDTLSRVEGQQVGKGFYHEEHRGHEGCRDKKFFMTGDYPESHRWNYPSFRGSMYLIPNLVAKAESRSHRGGRSSWQDHPASFASDVEHSLINNVRPVGSLRSAARTTMPFAKSKGYRIGEELSHARLTLHAASALKTQSRKGREGLKTLNHEERRDHEGWRRWTFFLRALRVLRG